MVSKPFRTSVIILCLSAVSLTFSLCLTISIASRSALEEQIRSDMGRSDITIQSVRGFRELPELSEEADSLPVVLASSYLQKHAIQNYKYVQKKRVFIIGVDTIQASAFGFLPDCASPSDDEAVISYTMAQIFGYTVGDTVILPCADGTECKLKVKEIVLNSGTLSVMRTAVIVTPDTARVIMAAPDVAANMIYVDAPEGKTAETAAYLTQKFSNDIVNQLADTPEIEASIRSLTRSFYLLFAVTLLMILFILSAFSKHIAADRLSAIGTLRSIGAEKTAAASTLLIECGLYGLCGGIAGALLFAALKDYLLGPMMPQTGGFSARVNAPLHICIMGILLPVGISCAVSLLSVIRSSALPIREIIFNGKDTVFHPTISTAVAGGVLVCGSAVLYFMPCGFLGYAAALAAFVIGLCLVIPKLLSVMAALTASRTNGGRLPVLRLAVIQSGTKKTAVTGTVICTAIVLMTASLYILSHSVKQLYSVRSYACDAIITELSERSDRYDTITAEQKEFVYVTEESTELNGKAASVYVFGYDGFSMFSGIRDLPDQLDDHEIALDKRLMERLGIGEGDDVTLTLKHDSVRPVTLTLTAAAGIDSIYYDRKSNAVLISLAVYKTIYHDYPSMLLVNGDTELMQRQLIDHTAQFETADTYYAQMAEEVDGITGLLDILTAAGMLLAVIAVAGEQTIGFGQRRHELAVLHSQGMSRGQLSVMLLWETVLTALLPAVIYLCTGRYVIALIGKALSSLDIGIPIFFDPAGSMVLVALLSGAVIATVLLPILMLRNMNTAEELKYE